MKKPTCLVCKKPAKTAPFSRYYCSTEHKKLIDNCGYYERGEFHLSKKGEQNLAMSGEKVI